MSDHSNSLIILILFSVSSSSIVSDSIDQNFSYFSLLIHHPRLTTTPPPLPPIPPIIVLTRIIHQTQSFPHQQQSALKTGEEE